MKFPIPAFISNLPAESKSEGVRAFVTMMPLMVGTLLGFGQYAAALGQAGFFYCTLPLLPDKRHQLMFGVINLTFGLGYYLIGGNITQNPYIGVAFMFMAALGAAIMTQWKLLGGAATMMMIVMCAGLNTSSPESAHDNFLVFFIALSWGLFISLMTWWKPIPVKPQPLTMDQPAFQRYAGLFAFGNSMAYAIAQYFGFSKLGWAPSAVTGVITVDGTTTRRRTYFRMGGVVAGAVIAGTLLAVLPNQSWLVVASVILAVIYGLTKETKLANFPLFYNAAILILYNYNTFHQGLILERILYNLAGVFIALGLVLFLEPLIKSYQDRHPAVIT